MSIPAKAKANHRLTAGRVAALSLLLCFVVAFILSQALVIAHADHDHDHNAANGECSVCIQLSDARGRLNRFYALARISAVPFVALAVPLILSGAVMPDRFGTLVHLKIQLNN